MAGGGGESLSDTPDWRIAVLVAAFIVITLVWEKLMDKLNRHLSAKHRLGLRHIVHKLEEELLALGLISLLLIALQESIVKICVDAPGGYGDDDGYGKSKSKSISHKLRKLAAAAGGDSCPKGKEPLWSITAMHQSHIFIFTLAVTHIVYAMLSMLICLYKLRRWEKWEKSMDHRLLAIPDKRLLSQDNIVIGYWRAFMASFMESIDRSVYLGLRRLFIERMSLTDSFNFHEFLVSSMEEEFSKVVKLDWVIWVLVGIWILAPPFVVFIMTGIALVVMVAVGTHLEIIAVHLTQKAFESYALPHKKKPTKAPSLLRKSLARISKGVLGKKSQTDEEVVKKSPNTSSTWKPHRDDLDLHMDREKTRLETREENRNSFTFQDKKTTPMGQESAVDNFYNNRGGDSVAVNIGQGPERRDPQGYSGNDDGQMSSSSSSDDEAEEPAMEGGSNDRALKTTSIGMVNNGRHQFESSKEFVGTQERIPVPMRIANWTRGVVNSEKYNRNMQLMRNQTFAESYEVEDSAELFWLQKPRLLLKAMQYIYFETSLLLSILLFNLWQGTSFIISSDYGHPNWLTLGLVILGLLLMVHSAFFVLPVYALTMAAGSHCPQSILRLAKKKKIKPEMVSALERMSGKIVNSARHPNTPLVRSADHDMDLENKVDLNDEHEGNNQTSLSTLLGAMYKETAKNFIRTREQDRVQTESVDDRSPARPRLMHTRSSGLLARTSQGSEISPGSPSRRSSSQKMPFGSFQTRQSTGADQANKSGNEIQMEELNQSPSLPLPPTSMPPTEPCTGHDLDQDGQLQGTSTSSEQGSGRDASKPRYDEHLRSKLAALTTSAEGSEGALKMPSQTILERPSEYTRKCTMFGNRPTLYEVALLFQKAESFTTDQNNRDRPVPRKGVSGP